MKKTDYLLVLTIILTVIGLFLIYQYLMFGFDYSELINLKTEKKGQYGDSFGALNTLFTGLAFAGLIVTILLQRQELRAQHKEFVEMNDNHAKMLKLQAGAQLILVYQDRIDRNYQSYQRSLDNADFDSDLTDPFQNENNFLMQNRDKILDELETLADVSLTSQRGNSK
jgi:hypothetical protein